MDVLMNIAAAIDGLTERLGRALLWLTLAMVGFGAYNAVARYLDPMTTVALSSNAFIETQWYLFSAVFLLGAGYTLKHGEHVRVDVLYGKLSPKGQAWINLVGTLIFFFPFCALMITVSWPSMVNSWSVREMSPDPGGLPRYPIKTLIPIAFLLLMVQGVSELIHNLSVITGRSTKSHEDDPDNPHLGDIL
ncbi:TRAP transporter small permease subunit [Sulfidibacter corallicola]|uniref:TRAP transporter small permease subunit n=1 Tax=Sulfidibacter corallicola TaxID=2818388 RepID=A0A8A4TDF4_SULCO|nr:TRAP transporter small permease subunit [Sulfidibacter corallicola]QTD47600.1 TRAP transporter small permease subunit [Sulfidibacter corallicola]